MPPAIRRLCLVVDIEAYSALDHQAQHQAQARLARALTAAVRAAGVPHSPLRRGVIRQNRGDGQLVLLPAGIDEARAISGLVRGLAEAMMGVNAEAPRLRLRAALAQGVVQVAATGYVGKSIVDACRLVDSAALREALAAAPERDVAVAFTDDLFRDVVIHGFGGLVGSDFRQVDVVEERKGFAIAAWVSRPDLVPTAPPAEPRRRWSGRAVAVIVTALMVLGAAAAWSLTHGGGKAEVVTASSPTGGPEARPKPPERFTFFDTGVQLDRCVELRGSGLVPPGHELRLYAEAGEFFYLTLLPAEVDRDTGTWTFPQVIFGPTPKAGVPITLYIALIPERESRRLTDNFDNQYAFRELPRRVVATHTFRRSADNGPC
ncbi:hypothetical protein GCM10009682_46580 [Luedemannella flava]|uniref:Uncharacterized protein n=2 Tax=Luedemannella flava TaxID=349316 RepID=A0ABP4YK59_9ACTN